MFMHESFTVFLKIYPKVCVYDVKFFVFQGRVSSIFVLSQSFIKKHKQTFSLSKKLEILRPDKIYSLYFN